MWKIHGLVELEKKEVNSEQKNWKQRNTGHPSLFSMLPIPNLLLNSGGVSLVDEEALTGRHVPLPDGWVRAPRDHEGIVSAHAVYVTEMT